jgi:hypothetical protein
MPEQKDNIITAQEIHLTDAEGNIVAVIKAVNMKGDPGGFMLTITDKHKRPRIRLITKDKPLPHHDPTVLQVLDHDENVVWSSLGPSDVD